MRPPDRAKECFRPGRSLECTEPEHSRLFPGVPAAIRRSFHRYSAPAAGAWPDLRPAHLDAIQRHRLLFRRIGTVAQEAVQVRGRRGLAPWWCSRRARSTSRLLGETLAGQPRGFVSGSFMSPALEVLLEWARRERSWGKECWRHELVPGELPDHFQGTWFDTEGHG
jgi:hypothetical protein